MSEKTIVISPPPMGQMSKKVDLDGNTHTSVKEPTEMDIQLYYYTITNSLKNYAKVKQNPDLYRNSLACDRCYQISSVREPYYLHKSQDIKLCEACFDEIKTAKDNYEKVECSEDPETGLKWSGKK